MNAAPIRKVILDLDETIIQRNQEFRYEDETIVPALESFDIRAPYPDGTIQDRTYYIRPGARKFLSYLVGEVKNKTLDLSFLSKSHQARLNAVLDAIQIDGESISHNVKVAFGSEIVNAYSLLKRPKQTRKLKDFDLIFHPKSADYYQHLKKDDRTFLPELTIVPCVVPNDTLMIDDSPTVTTSEYHDHIIRLREIEKKTGYWDEYKRYMSEPESLETSFQRQNFLSDLEIERHQFDIIQWLMEDAKRSLLPNDYSPWGQMLDTPKILVTEKIHFRYLMADLLSEDKETQDLVIVGRDMDLFNEVINQLKDQLNLKSRIIYIPMSRVVANSPENIINVLAASGIDVEKIRSGQRQLTFVDGGYRGTVPGKVIEAIFGNSANWRDNVQKITAHLFTSESKQGFKDPNQFDTLKEYVDASGFVAPAHHQNRFGAENLREVILHWEHARPKKNSRPYRLNEDNSVALDLSHPSENRVARLFDYVIRKLFWEESVINQLKEISNQSIPGNHKATNPQPVPEVQVSTLPKISKLEQIKYFGIRGTIRFLRKMGIDLSQHMPAKPAAQAADANKSQDPATATTDKISHRGDPRNRRLNPYDNDLSPMWIAWLEDRKNITRSEFSYTPTFAIAESKAKNEAKDRETNMSLVPTLRNEDPRLVSMGAVFQQGKRRNTVILLQLPKQKPISTDMLDQLIVTLAKSYRTSSADSPSQIFRQSDYSTSEFTNSAKDLQRDWHWVVHWLQLQLNRPYVPSVLAGQLHYLLTYRLVPFQSQYNEVIYDILDLVFIRAGYVPLAWDDLKKNDFKKEDFKEVGIHQVKMNELAKKPIPERANLQSVSSKMCLRYYGL